MKKTLLILAVILVSLAGISQVSLVKTDILFIENDTIFKRWYAESHKHDKVPLRMISEISLIQEYRRVDTVWFSDKKIYHRALKEGDSIKNPYGNNYFSFVTVNNYIYNNGAPMMDTLAKYHILNWDERIFE